MFVITQCDNAFRSLEEVFFVKVKGISDASSRCDESLNDETMRTGDVALSEESGWAM